MGSASCILCGLLPAGTWRRRGGHSTVNCEEHLQQTMKASSDRIQRPIAANRTATHDYTVLQPFEAGIVLTGTEVKSLRAGKANLKDSYATFPRKDSDEFVLMNLHISPYEHGNRENHDPVRPRRLLVKAREAHRYRQAIQEQGLTIVPLSMYFSGPYVKLEMAIVKGKKHYDKRADMKEQDVQRALRRGEE
ncbi:MAG: SsrA-binding protein SmpB [Candidatus Kapaibacterium sp.]